MTDYRPLLSRAVTTLDPNTGEARRAVYDRARTALVNQLRGMNPPLAEADITRERLALEEAIRKIEGDLAAAPPPRSQPAAQPPRAPASANDARGANDISIQDDADPFEPDAPPPSRRDARDTREPRPGNGRPDPRVQAYPSRGEAGPRPRPGRGKSPADYAREDARKATRTRLVVAGIVGVLFLLAAVVGYVHRERIFTLVGLGGFSATQDAPTKAPDRLTQQPQNQQQAPQPLPPSIPLAAGAQRALLFEENPGSQQFTTISGSAVWRTETINPGPGRSPELGVRIDIDIPDRKMQVVVTIRRNPDQSLPASHYIEIQFSGNDPYGGIAQVPAVRMKNNEAAQGVPLAGLGVRVMQGYFLVGLSAVEADRERNLQVLRSQPWIDIPFVYNNGRRAVIAFEKGGTGEKAMAEVFAAWGG